MIRNYKALGLALVAMFALSAFAAQGASASPLTVENIVAGGNVFITGDQDGGTHVFKTIHGEVICKKATFSAKQATEAIGATVGVTELTVTPDYKECTGFFSPAHVFVNGCTYTFTTPTSTGGGTVTWSGASQIHLVCPTGKSIEITPTAFGVSVCTQFVAPQTPTSGHVKGKNVVPSTPMDATLEIALTGIHYTGNSANNNPPCTDSSTHTEATLTGNSTIKCFSNEAHTTQVGCTFS